MLDERADGLRVGREKRLAAHLAEHLEDRPVRLLSPQGIGQVSTLALPPQKIQAVSWAISLRNSNKQRIIHATTVVISGGIAINAFLGTLEASLSSNAS